MKVFWAFIAVAGMWGSSFLFIKLGLLELEPFTLVALRTGFASLALLPTIPFITRRITIDRRSLLYLLIVGVMNPAVPYILITWGQQFVSSAIAGIINATVPLFALPFAHYFLRDEPITVARLTGLVVGFLGIVLIFSNIPSVSPGIIETQSGMENSQNVIIGQIAMLGAAVCYAGSMVFVRHSLRRTAPEIIAFSSQLSAFMITGIMAVVLEAPFTSSLSDTGWMGIVWLGISSGLSYILFYFVLSKWGTTRTSLVTYLVPVIAVTLGAVVLREVISWQSLIGGLFVISGIAVINTQARVQPA
jgi:drug/metabolite transporter (DMT)-like permease